MSKRKAKYPIVNGWYCVAVGFKRTRSGAIGTARHYLSKEADDPKGLVAGEILAQRKRRWGDLRAQGYEVWPDDAAAPSDDGRQAGAKPGATAVPSSSVAQAVKQYLAEQYEQRRAAGLLKQGTATTAEYRILAATKPLGSDTPLRLVDETAITATVVEICGRKEGNTIITAKAHLSALRRFLVWADEKERFGFIRPRRFDAIFRQHFPIQTDIERQMEAQKINTLLNTGSTTSNEVLTFSIPDLATYYAYASTRLRLWLLLMANCGFASEELNTLHVSELYLQEKRPYCARIRAKTVRQGGKSRPVYARWPLWAETVEALKAHIGEYPVAPDGYILRTGLGNRLVEGSAKSRKDGVYAAWYALYWGKIPENKRPRWLSPKYVRKTVAQIVRDMPEGVGGKAVADMLLSHADEGVITHYAGRNWEKLVEPVGRLRQVLQPLFDSAAEHDKVKATEEKTAV